MGDQEKKNDEETKEDKVQDENEKVDEGAAEGKEKGESVSDDQQELQRLEEEKLRIEGEGEQEREEAARLSEERRNLDKIASEANKTTEELATSYARKEQARKELIEERSKRDLEVKELSQQIETIKEIKGDDDPTLKNLEAKLKGLEEESKLDDVLEKDMVEQKTKLEELMKQHAASLAEIEAKRKAIEGEFETLALQRKKRGDEEKKILARIAELKGEAPPDEGQEAELKGEAPPGEGQEAELKGEAPPGEGQEAELKGEAPPDEGQEAELKGEATPGEGQEAELKGEAPPGEGQEAELKGEAPPREDQEAELEGEVPPGDVTKAELKAPSDESRGEQRGEVSFPLNDSAVFQLRETREKVLMAAKAIEILKEEFNKFQQKDHFTEEDMKNLPLQQNELMFRLAEFDVITKRVQHLMGLGETRAFELGPPRKFKFSLDIGEKPSARGNSQLLHPEDLPQVVVCGRDEQYPQLVVCGSRNYSDFQERIRRSESFHNGATVQGEMLNMPSDTQWPNNYQAADVFNPMGQGGAMGSPYYGTGMMGPFGQGNTAMPLEPWMIASGFGYTIRSMQGVQSTMVMPQRMMHSGHLQSASVGSFIPCPCICPKKKKKKKNKKAVPHQAYSCPCVATYSWKY